MKKHSFLSLMPVAACIALLAACAPQQAVKTEYTQVIPAGTTELAALYLDNLATKSGLKNGENAGIVRQLFALLADETSDGLAKELEALWADPSTSGIDWSAPLYVFNAPSLHAPAAALKVADLAQFQALVETLVDGQLCAEPVKADGFETAVCLDGAILLCYNDGTLLAVLGGSTTDAKKLQPAVTELMTQPAQKSFCSDAAFTKLTRQKGDIRLLATPDALPLSVRSLFNWPRGTQLLGYLLFENGYAYASLQQAAFEGDTAESNQPVHPKSNRELMAAINGITSGTPFNITLTSDEIVTLSNLRILMQFTDSPYITALYEAIQQIESLNLRGDTGRVNFTLALNQKSGNALKQILDFAAATFGDMLQDLDS
ncbi:MAG: DUF4836 family protein [Prevotellaceae bacterium]|nr:DUF4836 family protein [Prevotellaceae bacterium]